MSQAKKRCSGSRRSDLYDERQQSQLELELDVGLTILQRHQSAQGKTRYYQRVRMAFKALNRSKTVHIYSRLRAWESAQRPGGGGEWSLKQDRALEDEKQDLFKWATTTSCELLSRLESSVDILVAELSRGFFVPFNFTLFAIVARLWSLVGALKAQVHRCLGTIPGANDSINSSVIKSRPKILKKSCVQHVFSSFGIDLPEFIKASDDQEVAEQLDDETSESINERGLTNNSADNPEIGERGQNQRNSIFSMKPKSGGVKDGDAGESMDQILTSEGLTQNKRKRNATSPPEDNAVRVKEWQQSQKKKSKKIDDMKDAKRSKDRKKNDKKKKKSGDFFDDLFG